MSLNKVIAVMTAIALQANPAPSQIPTELYDEPLIQTQEEIEKQPVIPERNPEIDFSIITNAQSEIVVDVSSGLVLYAKNAKVQRPLASLTKLVSSMVILDAGLNPDEDILVHAYDIESIGRNWLESGESMKRGEAFQGMLIQSVNELANAFADAYPGGREAFVEAMNNKARTLELEDTTFVDPSGISPSNVSTALDIARIIRSALAYPEIREATEMSIATFSTTGGRSIRFDTTNNLLSSYLNQDPYRIVLGKTGSLPEAGYCLGQVTRHPDGQQIIAIVLGESDHFARFQDVKALTAWSFDAYRWEKRGESSSE